jgi:hypothetical protein
MRDLDYEAALKALQEAALKALQEAVAFPFLIRVQISVLLMPCPSPTSA